MLYLRRNFAYLLLLYSCTYHLQACKTKLVAIEPTYIHVDSFLFTPTNGEDPLTNINAIWVYYNDEQVGVFDLPATFPVLAKGNGKLSIAPAIAINGMHNMEGVYPFYTNDTFSFTAQPGYLIDRSPIATYYPATNFTAIDHFGSGSAFTGFTRCAGNVDLVANKSDSLLYNGQPTGGVFLNSAADSSIDSTTDPFPINAGVSSFIEFDYKCTIPFSLSMQANLGHIASSYPTFMAGIYPSTQWRKFYLYVSDFASQTGGTNYNLFIKAALPAGQSKGQILLANIRLLSLN